MVDESDNVKLELLAQNVERHDKYIEKLHESCDAIKDLTIVMQSLIKQHDQEIKETNTIMESRRIEREKEVKELHTRITHSEKEILEKIDQKVKDSPGADAVLDRIRKLENWKWMLLGGGVVIGFLTTKLPPLIQALNTTPLP